MKEEYLQKHQAIASNGSSLLRESGIIACFSILAVSVVMQFYLLVAVPDVLSTLFDLSAPQALSLTGMFGFFYAAGLLVWGRLASFYTPRSVMVLGFFYSAAFLWG